MTRTPVADRLRRSRQTLRAAGGKTTSVRLSPEAAQAAVALVQAGYAADRNAAINRALMEAAHPEIKAEGVAHAQLHRPPRLGRHPDP